MPILLFFLLLAVVAVVAMHLHFKRTADVRSALVGPEVFAIVGALIGISVGMIWFVDKSYRRIDIEKGLIHAFAGASVGGLVGLGVKEIFARLQWTRLVVVVLTLMLLAGSIGAPIGWLYGDVAANVAGDPEQMARSGMMRGTAIGCVVGLALGLLEAFRGGRPAKSNVAAPKLENVVP